MRESAEGGEFCATYCDFAFGFYFVLFSPRLFQAIDFAILRFPLFFRRRRNAEKCVNEIVVAPLLSLHFQHFSLKFRKLIIIYGIQNGQRKNISIQNQNELPLETDISNICVLYIIEHPDQAYAGFVLATIFGQFLELIALICHLPRCVYATSHKGAHYVCRTHTYANIMAHRTGQ